MKKKNEKVIKKKRITKKTIIIVIVSITLLLGIGFGMYYYFSPMKIILKGNSKEKLTYKTDYIEKGYYVKKLFFTLKKKKVITTNNIDNTKLGTYIVNYSIKGTNVKEKRTIEVVDDIKPEIVLKGDKELTMWKNEKYYEPGYSATDNYDGKITKKSIKVTDNLETDHLGEYEIKYSVCDKNKNCTEVIRKVNVIKGTTFYGTFRDKDYDGG